MTVLTASSKNPAFRSTKQGRPVKGFSLIEMMVALTIGLMVVIACFTAYLSGSQASTMSQAQARMNEDAQAALVILGQQLKMAGNNPDRADRVDNPDSAQSSRRNPVYGPTSFATGTYVPSLFAVRGCHTLFTNITTAANLDGLNCPVSSGGSASSAASPNSMALSYEADKFNTIPTGPANGALPTDCLGKKLDPITATVSVPATSGSGSTNADVTYAVADNRFYIATGGAQGAPGLYCKGSGTASTAQALVEGIEDLQLSFGAVPLATPSASAPSATVAGYLRADEVNAQATSTNDPVPWSKVVSVRICVLVRSEAEIAPDIASARYLRCDNTLETQPPDRRLRQAYFSTVVLRNRRL